MHQTVSLIIFLGFLVLMSTPLSHAHSLEVNIFAQKNAQEKELVFYVTSSGNEPVKDCHITLINDQGTVIADGHTNEEGRYTWVPQSVESITVRAYAGSGHKKSFEISAEELNRWLIQNHGTNQNTNSQSSIHSSDVQHSNEIQHVHSTDTNRRTTERVVLGLTFLLAGWAAWSSSRNAKKLDRIQELLQERDHKS